jgi:hypothetical protein
MLPDRAARGLNRRQGLSDAVRVTKPEPEVLDATTPAGMSRLALENQHVAAARSLRLDEAAFFVDRDDTDNRTIESQRALWIANREGNVGQPVGLRG